MKNQIKVTKEKLIKDVAKTTDKTVNDIKEIYNTLEEAIFDNLTNVNEEHDVCIKLFEGISLTGKYVSEKTKKNNLTGEMTLVDSKIKPKFNITRSYCAKLNNK